MFWFGDRIPLYITSSHYHHCANLSEDIEFIKCLSDTFCRVCDWEHILSGIHYSIYGAVCFQLTHLLCDNWENIYLSYYHHKIGSMNYYPLFKVRSWNNGVHRMSLYILIEQLHPYYYKNSRKAWDMESLRPEAYGWWLLSDVFFTKSLYRQCYLEHFCAIYGCNDW